MRLATSYAMIVPLEQSITPLTGLDSRTSAVVLAAAAAYIPLPIDAPELPSRFVRPDLTMATSQAHRLIASWGAGVDAVGAGAGVLSDLLGVAAPEQASAADKAVDLAGRFIARQDRVAEAIRLTGLSSSRPSRAGLPTVRADPSSSSPS